MNNLLIASDDDFFAAEAKAISAAVTRVGNAVVQIEVVGVAEVAGGQVAADAPTVGTVIDPEGYILATSQVTDRANATILVVLADGTRLPAEVVAKDAGRELVMLRVEPESPLEALSLEPAKDVRVGQYAIAVGRLRNDGPAARSVGIISALSRLDGRALQTDARISPPFYGGPLVNIQGEFLGIVVPAMPEMGGSGDKSEWYDSGIAFVAPADQIVARLERLKSGESIQPGRLGIVAGSRDPLANGTKVSAVRVGSPAAEVEIQPGDSIQSINGIQVARHADIKRVLGSLDAGTQVAVELLRDGKTLTVRPTLVAEIPPFDPQTLGLIIDERSEGVLVSAVFPGSAAERAGFLVNDTVTNIAGKAVADLPDLRNRVMTLVGGRDVAIDVKRGDQVITLKAKPDSVAMAWPLELPVLPSGPGTKADANENEQPDEKTEALTEWTIDELVLPDVPNKAAMVAPPGTAAETPHALLVVFAEPGEKDVKAVAESWKALASQLHVIVVVVGSGDPERWNPDEADVGVRLVAVVRKRFRIQPFAVAATGNGAGASLAMIAAFAETSTFSGVVIPSTLSPPAIQLRENDPSSPLHLMLDKKGELPPWATVLQRSGYAVIESEAGDEGTLKFVWSLGRI